VPDIDTTDRVQLGLTDAARRDLEYLETEWALRDRQDGYRLAIAVALARDLPPTGESASRTNYVSVGGVDPRGMLRDAILELRLDHAGRPYALAERLAEAGLRLMAQWTEDGRSIRELLASLVPVAGD
jgi:hypothetical protein